VKVTTEERLAELVKRKLIRNLETWENYGGLDR
jgi:hypothetical protein